MIIVSNINIAVAIKRGGRPTRLLPHAKMLLVPRKFFFCLSLSLSAGQIMLWKCASFSSHTSNVQLRLLERKANPLWLPRSHVVCAWPAISCKRYTVSLVYCAIVVKMHTSNRFHSVYGCVLILVCVMYFNVEAKCPADLKQNKTCRRDLSRICPACIEVSWLIRPPFTFQNGNYTSGIRPGT